MNWKPILSNGAYVLLSQCVVLSLVSLGSFHSKVQFNGKLFEAEQRINKKSEENTHLDHENIHLRQTLSDVESIFTVAQEKSQEKITALDMEIAELQQRLSESEQPSNACYQCKTALANSLYDYLGTTNTVPSSSSHYCEDEPLVDFDVYETILEDLLSSVPEGHTLGTSDESWVHDAYAPTGFMGYVDTACELLHEMYLDPIHDMGRFAFESATSMLQFVVHFVKQVLQWYAYTASAHYNSVCECMTRLFSAITDSIKTVGPWKSPLGTIVPARVVRQVSHIWLNARFKLNEGYHYSRYAWYHYWGDTIEAEFRLRAYVFNSACYKGKNFIMYAMRLMEFDDYSATKSDIKRLARKASLAHHPDKPGGSDLAFRQLASIKNTLLDWLEALEERDDVGRATLAMMQQEMIDEFARLASNCSSEKELFELLKTIGQDWDPASAN